MWTFSDTCSPLWRALDDRCRTPEGAADVLVAELDVDTRSRGLEGAERLVELGEVDHLVLGVQRADPRFVERAERRPEVQRGLVAGLVDEIGVSAPPLHLRAVVGALQVPWSVRRVRGWPCGSFRDCECGDGSCRLSVETVPCRRFRRTRRSGLDGRRGCASGRLWGPAIAVGPASPRNCSQHSKIMRRPGGADRVSERLEPAVGVDRQRAVGVEDTVEDVPPARGRARRSRGPP